MRYYSVEAEPPPPIKVKKKLVNNRVNRFWFVLRFKSAVAGTYLLRAKTVKDVDDVLHSFCSDELTPSLASTDLNPLKKSRIHSNSVLQELARAELFPAHVIPARDPHLQATFPMPPFEVTLVALSVTG